jgi:hypothetical protein
MARSVGRHGITRRELLKGGAAGTLALGLGPLLSACSAGPKANTSTASWSRCGPGTRTMPSGTPPPCGTPRSSASLPSP